MNACQIPRFLFLYKLYSVKELNQKIKNKSINRRRKKKLSTCEIFLIKIISKKQLSLPSVQNLRSLSWETPAWKDFQNKTLEAVVRKLKEKIYKMITYLRFFSSFF